MFSVSMMKTIYSTSLFKDTSFQDTSESDIWQYPGAQDQKQRAQLFSL